MAAANSPYSSTEETTNANRAYRLLLGPCSDQLRDVLRKEVPPHTFATEIMKQKHNLPRLTLEQRNIIMPQCGSYSGNYDDFDIPLLYTLLRNICNITPHKKGWGNVPDVSDACLSANIERIRTARNSTVHSSRPSFTNSEFNDIWTTVRVAVVAIDTFLSNANFYEKEVDDLRHTTMDPVQDKYYREQLAKQYEDDQECLRKLGENIKRYHEETATKISHLEARQTSLEEEWNLSSLRKKDFNEHPKSSCLPENIRDQHTRILQSWEKDIFYETSCFKDMKDFFISHQIVVVTGSTGCGKTALIRHIALQLESEYQIVPISKPEDIINYGDIKNSQIFIIDDVLGVFTLERNLLSDLERHKDQIENVLDMKSKGSKLFMSCRLAVYKEAKELNVVFFKENNILNLDSEDNSLTVEDRKGIFESHSKNAGVAYIIDKKILHGKGTFMFPLLCQMFSSDENIRKYGTEFFKYPTKCLISEIGKIKTRNKLQYLSMVLCMLNNNCLTEEMLTNTNMVEKACSSCRVRKKPQNWEIIEKLSHLTGTYITENDNKYTFTHDSMFEVIASHYGQQFPDQILENMSSNFIASKVVLDNTYSRDELCIKLSKSLYKKFASRLYDDIKEGNLHDVFLNKALLDPIFKKQFINILTDMPYEYTMSYFLYPRERYFENVILNAKKHSEKHNEETELQREFERQNLLLGLRCIGNRKIYEIRAISFIIYYGHLDLLKYFMEFVVRHHQDKSVIFGSTQEEQVKLLVLACYNGNLSIVKILIEHIGKESINKMPMGEIKPIDNRHRCITPVIAACLRMNYDVVKYLYDNGADFNPPNSIYPALWVPTRIGDLETVIKLLNFGADCNKCDIRGCSPLALASKFGHEHIVVKLIGHSAEINMCDIRGKSPLYLASMNGHLLIVKQLIRKKANINNTDIHGQTSLHLASQNGHLSVVETLIEHGADCDLSDKNNLTPLHRAALRGHASVVNKLIKHAADINKCDNHGQSALYLASWKGHLSVVEKLIERDADINKCNMKEQSPLHLASREGHLSVVEKLIEHAADVTKVELQGLSCLHLASQHGHLAVVEILIGHGASVLDGDENNTTPLHFASVKGHLPVVQALIRHGAVVNISDIQGRSSLYLASLEGHLTVVKKLIDFGADINISDIHGQTSLHLASQNGHLSVVDTLFEHGADCDLCDKNNLTPLHRAAFRGHASVVNKLTKHVSDIDKCDNHGQSSLYLASSEGHCAAVHKLIEHGADINKCNVEGRTPLHIASSKGHLPVVEKLIDSEADINKCDMKEQSPLHLASMEGHLSVVEELIKNGADVKKVDLQGLSCLHLASQHGYLPVVETLLAYIASCLRNDKNDIAPQGLSSKSNYMPVVKEFINYKRDIHGRISLFLASSNGYLSIVEKHIEYGADLNMCDIYGQSSLHIASQNGHLSVVEALISNGADCNLCDKDRITPLHRASFNGYASIAETLLEHGANINSLDINDKSSIYLASLKGHLPGVEKLIEHNANLNMCNIRGLSSLHIASNNGHLFVVDTLIKHGVEIDCCDKKRLTPIHFASLEGHYSVVEKLLKHGSSINMVDINGKSPLMLASLRGHLTVVQKLIEHGADINMSDASGRSALTLASLKGHLHVVEKLLEHGADINKCNL